MKNTIIVVVILIILGIGGYLLTRKGPGEVVVKPNENQTVTPPIVVTPPIASSTEHCEGPSKPSLVSRLRATISSPIIIRQPKLKVHETPRFYLSVASRSYSWNTTLVAYELMDYLEKTPDAIPTNVKVTVIPSLNLTVKKRPWVPPAFY